MSYRRSGMRHMNTGEAEEVVVGGVRPGWCDVTSGAAAALLLTVATVACAPKPPVECGGKIYPESASAEALSIVKGLQQNPGRSARERATGAIFLLPAQAKVGRLRSPG